MSGTAFWRGVRKRAAQAPASPDPAPPRTAAPPPLALVQKPASVGGLDDETRQLLDDLRRATQTAGLEPDDPMMPLVTAFARSIRFMADRGSISDHVLTSASERIRASLVEARHTADAEAERFSAAVLKTEANIIQRIAGSIAASADRALTRRVEVFDRNTALLAAALLFGTAVAFGVGGYVWGGNAARAEIHETEAGLRAAFAHEPGSARTWLNLMTWNDIAQAEAQCSTIGLGRIQDGRRGCTIPLWTEPPISAPPAVIPAPAPTLGQALDQAQQAVREAQAAPRPRERNPPSRTLPAPSRGVAHFGSVGEQ